MAGTNDTYRVPLGVSAHIGRNLYPTWVSAAVAGRWGTVPVSAALSTLNTRDNPSINPVYPSSPEWYGNTGFTSIMYAWCGGCYDTSSDVFWLPLQGGHQDYAGNEPYKLQLNSENPTWVMLRPPSGAIGNLLTTNDGQESSGVYSDGRPRAVHSYNKPVYVPGVGPYIALQGNTSWTAGGGRPGPIKVDPITGEATFYSTNTLLNGVSSGLGSTFDPTRGTQGSIWVRGVGTGRFHRFDVATDTWYQNIGPSTSSTGYCSLAYMPEYDCIMWSDTFGQLRIFDCSNNTVHTPSISGTITAALSGAQLVWVNGKAYTWNNSSNTTLITRISPGADPRTSLIVDTLVVGGGNATVPNSAATTGTYGRFWYSTNFNMFFLTNGINGPVYYFKPLD